MALNILLNFGNLFDAMSDEQMMQNEIRLAIAAEGMGFDALWAVEHHFNSYAMCPSNTQLMSYIAGQTSTIKLGLGAVILPWNDPVRVVENVTLLDIVSGGRTLLAFGRGLAKQEYDGFKIDLSEARGRFNEAAKFIMQGLESGVAEWDGEFYKQPRVEIRPSPPRSFQNRLYCVAQSADSIPVAAALGAQLCTTVQGAVEQVMPGIETYRTLYQEATGNVAPIPTLSDVVFCHADAAEAERMARQYLTTYLMSVIHHYRLLGNDWDGVKGYDAYRQNAEMLRSIGKEALLEGYIAGQSWGTPDQIIEKYKKRLAVTGGHHTNYSFSFGAMPYADVEASMRLFSSEVMPALRQLDEGLAIAA